MWKRTNFEESEICLSRRLGRTCYNNNNKNIANACYEPGVT